MKVERTLLNYRHPIYGQEVRHYILFINFKGESVLLSEINLYLLEVTKRSIQTSNRYSRVLQKFLQWLIDIQLNKPVEIGKEWLLANNELLKKWQVHRSSERLREQSLKPTSETIFNEAMLVTQCYQWLNSAGYQTSVRPALKSWKPSKKDMLLPYVDGGEKHIIDGRSIAVLDKESRQNRNKCLISDEQIKLLLSSYTDPVYSCLFNLSLATALRPHECVTWPYIGVGQNNHIRPWKDMEGKVGEKFTFTLLGKGLKQREINISSKDWATISNAWMPLYIERRKLYKKKHNRECPIDILWLTKKGEPVTEKMIADATFYARKAHPSLERVEFYDARRWWATMFVIELLGQDLWKEVGLHAAAEEVLRNQMGHSNVGTTYEHYVKLARSYLATQKGLVNEIIRDEGALSLLNPEA